MTSPVCSEPRWRRAIGALLRAFSPQGRSPLDARDVRRRAALRIALLALAAVCMSGGAFAFEPFVVRDIRVEGVQRTEAGTVFSYLPIKVGDRIDDE